MVIGIGLGMGLGIRLGIGSGIGLGIAQVKRLGIMIRYVWVIGLGMELDGRSFV